MNLQKHEQYGKVTELKPVLDSNIDDLWICCANLESRCKWASELARRSKYYNSKNALVLSFDSRDIDESLWTLVSKNRDAILSSAERFSQRTHSLEIPLKESKKALWIIKSFCDDNKIPLDNSRISFDISVLTKRHNFVFLHYLDYERKNNTIKAIYTFPKKYLIHNGEPMNRALDDITSIHRFGGKQSFSKENLLIAFLGFEGQRTLAVWERLEPDLTIAVIGRPPFRKDWDIHSEILNSEILSLDTVKACYAPILKPYAVRDFLCEIYNKYHKLYNIFITPMGPKHQALGTYMFARDHRDVQITYTIPSRFRKPFSEGIGGTWECMIC